MVVGDLRRKVTTLSHCAKRRKSATKLNEKSNIKNMDLTRIKTATGHNGNGLLYRYGSKSRRKVISLLLAMILIPLTCDADDKIVRVDPLGKNIFSTEKLQKHFVNGRKCKQLKSGACCTIALWICNVGKAVCWTLKSFKLEQVWFCC